MTELHVAASAVGVGGDDEELVVVGVVAVVGVEDAVVGVDAVVLVDVDVVAVVEVGVLLVELVVDVGVVLAVEVGVLVVAVEVVVDLVLADCELLLVCQCRDIQSGKAKAKAEELDMKSVIASPVAIAHAPPCLGLAVPTLHICLLASRPAIDSSFVAQLESGSVPARSMLNASGSFTLGGSAQLPCQPRKTSSAQVVARRS